jgi:hypothetical protein
MLYISIVWCDSPGRVEYQKEEKWGILMNKDRAVAVTIESGGKYHGVSSQL